MRMKRINLLMMFVAVAAMGIHAANPGETCSTAIPMGKDYSAQVKKSQTVWYSAWTFDLPLTVTFAPTNGKNDPAPVVEMDFSCTSGYYEDSILCSLFCKTSGSGVAFDLPHKPSLSSKTLDDGTFVYYLSLGKQYRDLLLQVGISYNVQVYVKVVYQSAGIISLAPDDLFSNCVDGAKFMQIGDTVNVQLQDKKRHVIVPYVQWQEDTILYTWTGNEPCQLTVANTCDFDPLDNTDDNVIQFKTVQPNSTLKTPATAIYDWVHNPAFPNEAGMYYAKFYSNAPGVMKITRAQQAPPEADATILRYDRTYALDANSTAVYAIPRSWDKDVKFTTPTAHLFTMMIATSASFDDEEILKKYAFEKTTNGRWVGILGSELKTFWNKVPNDKNYLYIRFICTEATTVTPELWSLSDCYKNTASNLVVPNQTITVLRNSQTHYRFSYADWVGGDMTIKFAINSNCDVYIADTCGTNIAKADMPYWLRYKTTIKSSSPLTIPADEIASWADRIDDEGFFYAVFYTSATSTNRKLTFTTTKPEETDPTYPASTIAVVCDGGKIVVNVSEAQTITVIDELGAVMDKWDAEPGTPHELNLPPGNYSLAGEKEKISLKL